MLQASFIVWPNSAQARLPPLSSYVLVVPFRPATALQMPHGPAQLCVHPTPATTNWACLCSSPVHVTSRIPESTPTISTMAAVNTRTSKPVEKKSMTLLEFI